jgi:hypothetical protein
MSRHFLLKSSPCKPNVRSVIQGPKAGNRGTEGWGSGMVEWWSGGRMGGGMMEWCNDGVVEWWKDGRMEWWSGGMMENGRMDGILSEAPAHVLNNGERPEGFGTLNEGCSNSRLSSDVLSLIWLFIQASTVYRSLFTVH